MLNEVIGKFAQSATQNGSPDLLAAVGRAFGLGQAEQKALAKNGVPSWVLLVLGVGGGVVLGVYLQKKHPSLIPNIGKSKALPNRSRRADEDDSEDDDE